MINWSYNYRKYFGVVCLLHCMILLSLTTGSREAQDPRTPASGFNKHIIVQPTVHHARTKREIASTRDASGAHHSEVTMKVPIDGRELVLDLQLNKDLITDNHVIRYQEGGKTVTHRPKKEDIDLCQYSGTVRGKPGSWVAVSTCRGVRGVIFDGNQMRYIEPAEGDEIQSRHYVYDHSDLKNKQRRGYVDGANNYTRYEPQLLKEHHAEKYRKPISNRYKRSTEGVRGPYNANKRSRYVELVLVADNREFIATGRNLRALHDKLKTLANIINSVFAPLDIFIALVGVEVWTEYDKILFSKDSLVTLTNFLSYRIENLVRYKPHDNAQLLTRQHFDGGVIGKALRGSMCSAQSGGIAEDHSTVIGLVAITIAHEMGHNFNMDHDVGGCECPDQKCIMSPVSNSIIPAKWSSCSLQYLTSGYEKGLDYCLRNKPKRLFESPTCGNGFVEPGEQCDCGKAAYPNALNPCHACCQPDTCMLRHNATCAAGACCDLQTCRPRAAGAQCRPAERECDLPEYCTGQSEFCPDDVYKMDTTPCGRDDDRAYCVGGWCRSHRSQCRLLWGPTGLPSHNDCYTKLNVQGTKSSHCGYDWSTQQFRRCWPPDAACGSLQCQHLARQPAFGTQSRVMINYLYSENSLHQCHAIEDDPRATSNVGMVPDGAKCGEDMMCVQQRCVAVSALRARIAARDSSVCPSNCSGHGVCNSEGHCHCEAGFAPPLCALPGAGGSYDSGPATDPILYTDTDITHTTTTTIMENTIVAIYVIFFGVVPALLLIFLIYHYRQDLAAWWNSYVHRLHCCGCRNNTGHAKQTIAGWFQYTTSSLTQTLRNIKTNAHKGETTTRLKKTKVETKITIVKNTDGEISTSMLTNPIRRIDKHDIHIVGGSNDEHVYANVHTNIILDSNLKIIGKPMKKYNIDDIEPRSSKDNMYRMIDKNTTLIMNNPTMNTQPKIDIGPIKNNNKDGTDNTHSSSKDNMYRMIDRNTKMDTKSIINKSTLDTKPKIDCEPIKNNNKEGTDNISSSSKDNIYRAIDKNTKMNTKSIINKPTLDTKPKIDTRPMKNFNDEIQSAHGNNKALLKARPQVPLKPTSKTILSKAKRPTVDNSESITRGTVSNIRHMFDSKNATCVKTSNARVGIKK